MEATITAEPYVPNLKTLREKIDQDTNLLGSLDPNSDAYRRLQTRITDQTTQLLDYEEVLEERCQQAGRVAAEHARREAEASGFGGALLFAFIGFIVTVACWGTGWVALGIVLLLIGIGGAVASVKNS